MIQQETLPALSLQPEINSCLENLDISYDAGNKVLIVNWEGEISTENIRNGYSLLMQSVHLRLPRKILLDFHNRLSIHRRDQRWVFSSVFPEILRTVGDNVFVAIVLPVELYHGLVADLNGDELMNGNDFLIIHHSLYREEAIRWLNAMQATAART